MNRSAWIFSHTMALMLVSCIIAGCGGTRVEIPKPTDVLEPPPPTPSIEQSVVHLKVSVPVNELAIAADAALPTEAGQEEAWLKGGSLPYPGSVQYQYRIVRGPLQWRMAENRLATHVPDIQYRIAVRLIRSEGEVLEGRCGYGDDPPKRLRLTAHSLLSWTDRWTLKSDTSFDQPEFLEPCRLTNLGIDATPILTSLMNERLGSVAEAIDTKVRERGEARQRAGAIWQRLQEPAELEHDLWLSLNPVGAQAGPISAGGDHTIRTSVSLILEPRAQVGSKPTSGDRPLPPLELISHQQDGFHLAVPLLAEYSVINRRLEQRLVGQEFPTSLGEPLTITSVQMYGSGANLILNFGVTGAVNGNLYATGKPVFDAATQTLSFYQLEFTVNTKNVLVGMANWLFYDDLLARLEPRTRIDLSHRIEEFRRQLSRTPDPRTDSRHLARRNRDESGATRDLSGAGRCGNSARRGWISRTLLAVIIGAAPHTGHD